MKKTAVELGFKPEMKPMTKEQTEHFMQILLGVDEPNIPEKEVPFTVQILNGRLEALKKKITITTKAKYLLWILTEQNPGKMVASLVDCLTQYEGKVVDTQEIAELYPMGFYTDKSVMEYVDKYLKTNLCKWSEIY